MSQDQFEASKSGYEARSVIISEAILAVGLVRSGTVLLQCCSLNRIDFPGLLDVINRVFTSGLVQLVFEVL